MTAAIPRVDLAPGYGISRILKGGWQLAGGHGPIDREAALDDMQRFVDAGVTTFDCADIYTGVEALIGAFLARVRRRAGPGAADRIQVHTKYVPDLDRLSTLGAGDVARAVDRALGRLGVDAIDLVQFHWWDYRIERYLDVARWLDDQRRAGKIRHLGLTNFDTPRMTAFIDAGIPIVAHQVQYSVLDRRPARALSLASRARGVGLLAYGALAGGFLSTVHLGQPAPATPLENRSLVKYRLIIDECGGWDRFQVLLRALDRVAARHGVDLSAVALRWVLDQPGVAGVIVGARHPRHLSRLRQTVDLRLDRRDLAEIDACHEAMPGPPGDVYELERRPGGPHAAVMRYTLNADAG